MIHGDVFRSPEQLNLFSALIGSGAQIFSTVLLLLVCVLIGVFKATKRGALLTAVILIYAVSGIVGGIVAGRIFKQLKGKNWVWNIVLTASVFPIPLCIIFSWVNTVAWNRKSTAALPFTTIMVMNSHPDHQSALLHNQSNQHLLNDYILTLKRFFSAHDGHLPVRTLSSHCGGGYSGQEHNSGFQTTMSHEQSS